MQGRKKVVGLVALLALLGTALYAYQAHETAGGGAGARGRHVCRPAPLRHRRRAAHLPRGRDAPGDRSDFLPMLGVAAVAMPLAGWLFRKRS